MTGFALWEKLFFGGAVGIIIFFCISIIGQYISVWDLYLIGSTGMVLGITVMVLALVISNRPKGDEG